MLACLRRCRLRSLELRGLAPLTFGGPTRDGRGPARWRTRRARPRLSLLATEDPYIGSDEIGLLRQDAGARTEVLDGLGHRWMVDDPARGAAALNLKPGRGYGVFAY